MTLLPTTLGPGARPYADALVGRGGDLAALAALFDADERLVTVVGTAGVGKTRLAIEYATRWAATRAVCVCDLSAARTLYDAATALGAAAGVPLASDPGAEATIDRLGAALAARIELLVVLDNFEQLVPLAHATLARLRVAAPEVRWLVTSREGLRISSERIYALEPLRVSGGDDDAVALLLDRVERAGGVAMRGRFDVATAAAIARQVDGLPLALELVAPRLAALGAATVLARLAQRFELLSHGARDAVARQSTLRAALDWSWDLLAPVERDALAQCAVFSAGFALDAAEAVIVLGATDPPVVDVLQSLVEKSLLRALVAPAGATRFELLLSVHEYAAARLAEDPPAQSAAHARHAGWYVPWAARLGPRVGRVDGATATARLERERDNLLAVVARALAAAAAPGDARAAATTALHALLALDPLVAARGPAPAQLKLLDAALGVATGAGVEPGLQARGLIARAGVQMRVGHLVAAEADGRAAVARAEQCGDVGTAGQAYRHLAEAVCAQLRDDDAAPLFERAIERLRAAGDEGNLGVALTTRAGFETSQGDYARAHADYVVGLELLRAAGNLRDEAHALGWYALSLAETGRVPEARATLERALELARTSGEAVSTCQVLGNLAIADHVAGDLVRAEANYRDALAAARALGESRMARMYPSYLGLLLFEQGRAAEAEAGVAGAVALARAHGAPWLEALGLAARALLEFARGDDVAAAASLVHARGRLGEGEPLLRALELLDAHGELSAARRAIATGDLAAAHKRAARVDARLSVVAAQGPAPVELQLAARTVRASLAELRASLRAPLRVHADALWLVTPSGASASWQTRAPLRRLLLCLLAARTAAPGRAVTADALIEAGWPGESLHVESGRNRLKVALSTMRSLGLRELLLARDEGYLLDPDVPVLTSHDEAMPTVRSSPPARPAARRAR